ncbi:hypothetical protein G6F58_012880 [Rhizopus delemar]|nr:hypothetical protein G6F58_012880 [Rhizopus delemar]
MTQLLEQAVYSPGAGRFKVYMIDEVHMLTGHAFNAMLKTLEEPPEHPLPAVQSQAPGRGSDPGPDDPHPGGGRHRGRRQRDRAAGQGR